MSSSKHSWIDLTSDSSAKTIKDETFDCNLTENSSLRTNVIDYTIIDSEIDPLHLKNHHSIGIKSLEKSHIKNKKTRTMKCK